MLALSCIFLFCRCLWTNSNYIFFFCNIIYWEFNYLLQYWFYCHSYWTFNLWLRSWAWIFYRSFVHIRNEPNSYSWPLGKTYLVSSSPLCDLYRSLWPMAWAIFRYRSFFLGHFFKAGFVLHPRGSSVPAIFPCITFFSLSHKILPLARCRRKKQFYKLSWTSHGWTRLLEEVPKEVS